jgi:hypothetical protein
MNIIFGIFLEFFGKYSLDISPVVSEMSATCQGVVSAIPLLKIEGTIYLLSSHLYSS